MKKYFFKGKVKSDAKRGAILGYPTANVTLHHLIPEGIYASTVSINKVTFQASTFIGSSKTFEENDYKAEVHILDFNKNIYGKWISVILLKKIRDNKKFSSIDALVSQIKKDVLSTREFFSKLR
jgi:riboflavin kinase/FMN adenylyltransferase